MKKTMKGIKIFLKKKKKNSGSMIANDIKILPDMINRGLLSIEKVISKCEKRFEIFFSLIYWMLPYFILISSCKRRLP